MQIPRLSPRLPGSEFPNLFKKVIPVDFYAQESLSRCHNPDQYWASQHFHCQRVSNECVLCQPSHQHPRTPVFFCFSLLTSVLHSCLSYLILSIWLPAMPHLSAPLSV